MFLATTALSEFWDKNEKILFLGSWCLRRDRQAEWKDLTYEVMPSVWNDRKRFFEAASHVEECYERMLHGLAHYLNAVHGVRFSVRYWRILIGPWLLYYLHSLYDRYVHLSEALRAHPDLRTVTLDPRSFRVPGDTLDAIELLGHDAYNLQLFSHLLQSMGYDYPTQAFENGWPGADGAEEWPSGSLVKGLLKNGFRQSVNALRRAGGKRIQVGLCEMYTPRAAMWSLALRMRLRALPLEIDDRSSLTFPAAADGRRQGLAYLPAADIFEKIAWQALPANLPTLFLEGYSHTRARVGEAYPRVPPVIMSGTGWYTNESFKFLAAEAAEGGTRLLSMQHGGSYGFARFSAPERHEMQVSDSFMVWGWANNGAPRCRNLPNPKLSLLLSTRDNRESKTILFVATQCPRYLYRFDSTPVAGQWEEYFDWSLRFLAALSEEVRSRLLFRPFFRDYGWKLRERVSERFRDIRMDNGTPLHERLRQSRLVVINYRETAFLETLAADIPTVLFWDRNRWELRPEAESLFEDLRRVGILWDSPEGAAAKVEQVYDDPWQWWTSEPVQQARREFADRYALSRSDWAQSWMKMLSEEVTRSHSAHPA